MGCPIRGKEADQDILLCVEELEYPLRDVPAAGVEVNIGRRRIGVLALGFPVEQRHRADDSVLRPVSQHVVYPLRVDVLVVEAWVVEDGRARGTRMPFALPV